jgi:parallel beta-helix repeat protein
MRKIEPVRTPNRRHAVCLFLAFTTFVTFANGQESTAADTTQPVDSNQTTHDATEMLQRMVEASSGLVELPAGTFTISRPIVVDLKKLGYRGIRGANGATRIIMTGAGPAIRIVGDHRGTANPESVEEHTWERERFPIVSGIEILGRHPEADGIEVFRTMKCTIQNVLIRQCRYGIHLVERNRNFLLADSHIYHCLDTGVFLDDCDLHQVNIIGNHISYNQRAGIRQWNGDVHNIQITGNDIEYNAGSEESSGEVVLEAPEGIVSEYVITGNTIQARPENQGANIRFVGSETDSPFAARAITIASNVIGSRNMNIAMQHASRASITGNTIYGGTERNVHLEQCQNIVLGNNVIGTRPSMHESHVQYLDGILLESCVDVSLAGNVMTGLWSGAEDRGGALTLRDCRFVRISNCQIQDSRFRGIDVVNGEGCVVSENTIANRIPGEQYPAIVFSGEGHGNLVQGNLVFSANPEPLAVPDGMATVTGNTIEPVGES